MDERRSPAPWIIGVAIVVAAVIVAGALVLVNQENNKSEERQKCLEKIAFAQDECLQEIDE